MSAKRPRRLLLSAIVEPGMENAEESRSPHPPPAQTSRSPRSKLQASKLSASNVELCGSPRTARASIFRLPEIYHPDLLVEKFAKRDGRSWTTTTATKCREEAMAEVGGILEDYKWIRSIQTPAVERMTYLKSPTTESNTNGGTTFRIKSNLNGVMRIVHPDTFEDLPHTAYSAPLAWRLPSKDDLENAKHRKEATKAITDICNSGSASVARMQRTLVNWIMYHQKASVKSWRHKMEHARQRQRAIIGITRKHKIAWSIIHWFFFHPLLRVIRWWSVALHLDKADEAREAELVKDFETAATFTADFLMAVDKKGVGGLSLCDLKAADLSHNDDFSKAALWLVHGRTFQRYDAQSIGVVRVQELVPAMNEFLTKKWMFDGVLW